MCFDTHSNGREWKKKQQRALFVFNLLSHHWWGCNRMNKIKAKTFPRSLCSWKIFAQLATNAHSGKNIFSVENWIWEKTNEGLNGARGAKKILFKHVEIRWKKIFRTFSRQFLKTLDFILFLLPTAIARRAYDGEFFRWTFFGMSSGELLVKDYWR